MPETEAELLTKLRKTIIRNATAVSSQSASSVLDYARALVLLRQV